jgi:uncharacterized membrane protein (GlpM family)
MASILITQLLISFFAGGLFITLLSLIAEKTSHHISGIIMMFPTTLVLGFFFLGFTTSAKHVSAVIPATLIPLGLVAFSSVIYIYSSTFFAAHIKNKISQIFFSLLTSAVIWFILASPFAIYKFSNAVAGIVGFFIIITATHCILHSKNYDFDFTRPVYTKIQILIRAVFTGTIIATVVLLGKTLNPFWGGIFTMFPAATFSTLMVLHFYYPPTQLSYFMKNAPLGAVSLFVYAIAVMLLFPKMGIYAGTLVAYCISLAFGLLLIKQKLRKNKI